MGRFISQHLYFPRSIVPQTLYTLLNRNKSLIRRTSGRRLDRKYLHMFIVQASNNSLQIAVKHMQGEPRNRNRKLYIKLLLNCVPILINTEQVSLLTAEWGNAAARGSWSRGHLRCVSWLIWRLTQQHDAHDAIYKWRPAGPSSFIPRWLHLLLHATYRHHRVRCHF
jgi:hypothetical protein